MALNPWKSTRILTAAVLAVVMCVSQNAKAQASQHLVSPQDLSQATQDASHARQQNLDTLHNAFSSKEAQKALVDAHMNPQEVQNAISGLNDQDLAQLAQRASNAQTDFAAGNMSDHDLLLILVIVAVIILLIVALH